MLIILFAPFVLPVFGVVSVVKAESKKTGSLFLILSFLPLVAIMIAFLFAAMPQAC